MHTSAGMQNVSTSDDSELPMTLLLQKQQPLPRKKQQKSTVDSFPGCVVCTRFDYDLIIYPAETRVAGVESARACARQLGETASSSATTGSELTSAMFMVPLNFTLTRSPKAPRGCFASEINNKSDGVREES